MFKRLVMTIYLPKHFVVYGHSWDHGVKDQFLYDHDGVLPFSC